MNIREKKHRWVRRARLLVGIELILSVIFDLTMIGVIIRGQVLNILLIVVITLNICTAARLFLKLRGVKCASSIMAYVVWKIIQEVVMIPALIIFSFILVDQYLKSWTNPTRGIQTLVIVWTYAIYSLFLIIFLAWLSRFLWQLQVRQSQSDKNENATRISFIDSYQEDYHQPLVENGSSAAQSNEGLELKDMNGRGGITDSSEHRGPRTFVPYDHVVPFMSH